MNSFSKIYLWYLVTSCINSIQLRPNSLVQTEYGSYLVRGNKDN